MTDNTTITTAGVAMPRIIYGTAWKKDRTAAYVEQALTVGFRGIDTACQPKHYHEAGVGDGMARAIARCGLRREALYLQTKFTPLSGQDPQRVPYDPQAPLSEQVTQSCRASLSNLKTDYLDGLILHSPPADPGDLFEVWHAMESLVDQAFTRQIGISNCYDIAVLQALHRHARIKPALVQNRFYADTGYDVAIRAFCNDHGLIYQSFWTLTANPAVLASDVMRELAEHHGRTPPQIMFRYLSQIGIVPLTGTTSKQHMQDDLAIFDFQLTTVECNALTALLT